MQTSTIFSWRSRGRESDHHVWPERRQGFLRRHQFGEVVQGLIMSSVLWSLLAVGVYAVYSLVLGSR